MAFQFKNASCVAVGTFNIYIIQPPWLKAVGLIDDTVQQIVFESDFKKPGFRMRLPKITWTVEPTRVVLETDDPRTDCGSAMLTILTKLPFTPLHAMGINTAYEAQVQDVELSAWRHPVADNTLATDYALEKSGWGASLKKGRETYNIHLVVDTGKNTVTATTNVEIMLTEADDNSVATKMAANCLSVQRASTQLLQDTFNLRIEHADNDVFA